ncbi:MAG TPA: hypothetical protein VF824_18080 [Thermoanaerobaculia bacterium]|jgi:enoyl-CoA hydratase/carnithine racemase
MRFVGPAELRGLDGRGLDELLAHSGALIGFGDEEVSGTAAAALLFCDFAVLRANASLRIDTAEAWAGAAWRLGRKTLTLFLRETQIAPEEAHRLGLCDDVTDADAEEWRERWMAGRSDQALDSAAALIRLRGGDRLERAEFARLFATGTPGEGLGAFLEKRKAEW